MVRAGQLRVHLSHGLDLGNKCWTLCHEIDARWFLEILQWKDNYFQGYCGSSAYLKQIILQKVPLYHFFIEKLPEAPRLRSTNINTQIRKYFILTRTGLSTTPRFPLASKEKAVAAHVVTVSGRLMAKVADPVELRKDIKDHQSWIANLTLFFPQKKKPTAGRQVVKADFFCIS